MSTPSSRVPTSGRSGPSLQAGDLPPVGWTTQKQLSQLIMPLSSILERAIDRIYSQQGDQATLDRLRSIFPEHANFSEEQNFTRLHKIVLDIEPNDLEEHLSRCNNVDATDLTGRTALYWACVRDDKRAMRSLLKHNANPNIADIKGISPLLEAIGTSDFECLELLLAHGADPLHVSHFGRNALHHATFQRISNEHISKGAFHRLASSGVDVELRDQFGVTPVFSAVVNKSPTAIAALIECGANVNTPDITGDSPLQESIFGSAEEITRILLLHGAKYTSLDSFGNSILHSVALWGGIRTIEIMLAARLQGVDPEAQTPGGKTALQLAQDRKDSEPVFIHKLVELLDDVRKRNAAIEAAVTGSFTQTSPGLGVSRNFYSLRSWFKVPADRIRAPYWVTEWARHWFPGMVFGFCM